MVSMEPLVSNQLWYSSDHPTTPKSHTITSARQTSTSRWGARSTYKDDEQPHAALTWKQKLVGDGQDKINVEESDCLHALGEEDVAQDDQEVQRRPHARGAQLADGALVVPEHTLFARGGDDDHGRR